MSEHQDDKSRKEVKDLETKRDPKAGGGFKPNPSPPAGGGGGTTTQPIPNPGS